MAIVNTTKTPAGIPVIIIDDAAYKEYMGRTGGATCQLAKNLRCFVHRSELRKVNKLQLTRETPIVLWHVDSIKEFHPDEVRAILLHEEGHVLNYHFDLLDEIDAPFKKKLSRVDLELEADQYAIKQISPDTMISSLMKSAIKNQEMLIANRYITRSEFLECRSQLWEEVRVRIAAIKAFMGP